MHGCTVHIVARATTRSLQEEEKNDKAEKESDDKNVRNTYTIVVQIPKQTSESWTLNVKMLLRID